MASHGIPANLRTFFPVHTCRQLIPLHLALLLLIAACLMASGCGGRYTSGDTPTRSRALPGFPVIMWVDWAGTGEHFAGDPAAAMEFCRQARDAGVTHLALETRTSTGRDAIGEYGAHGDGERNLRLAAREHGLRLAALVPAFLSTDEGFNNPPRRARWMDGEGWKISPLTEQLPAKSSPASPQARTEEIRHLRELLQDSSLELIFLSGFGFEDTHADLSPLARREFEQWRGGSVRRWPDAILGDEPPSLPYGSEGRGPHWNAWMTWRARVLRDLLILMKGELASEEFPPRLGVLVDAPYPSHQRLGLNWASPETMAEVEHRWLPSDYGRRTAAGHLLDVVALTFWQPDLVNSSTAERQGFAWWASIEGATSMARRYRRPNELPPWLAIPVRRDTQWEAGVRGARLMGGGLVVFPASEFVRTPANWTALVRGLQAPAMDQ